MFETERTMNDQAVDAVVRLGELVARYALVNRVTYLADGVTPESDTDHTVMVGVIACAVAASFDKRLDVGLVAQFALVHDLVEAYAGDTNTFGGLSEERHLEKERREAEALVRIDAEFSEHVPWVAETIRLYESLSTPEARFVKVLDKVMPKITRMLNKRHATDAYTFDEHCRAQLASMLASYAHDQEVAVLLYNATTDLVSDHLHHKQGTTKTTGSEA